MSKVVNYLSESFEELKSNVTWASWAEVQRLTIVVAVFSVIFALMTTGVDNACEYFVENIVIFLKKTFS